MSDSVQRIKYPELVFGFVAPIGAHVVPVVTAFRSYFERRNYRVVEIKVTDVFEIFERYVAPQKPLARQGAEQLRFKTFIAYGNQLRKEFGDPILAATAILRVIKRRLLVQRDDDEESRFTRTVFLIHQFKRKEEIDLLRSVYGRIFPGLRLFAA